MRCQSLIPDAHPRPLLSGLKSIFPAWSLIENKLLELNKIIGAILGTCLVLLVTSFTAGALFAPEMPKKPGFEIAVKEEAGGGHGPAAPAPSEPIEKLLQTAAVDKGAAAAKKCAGLPRFHQGWPQ